MIRLTLVNFLNRHKVLQLVAGLLPVILITVYLFAFMYDVVNLLGVFEYNNKVTKTDMDSGRIKEVDLFEESEDGSYTAIMSGEDSVEVDVGIGDIIYSMHLVSDSWYYVLTETGKKLYTTEQSLFGVVANEGNTYTISVGDDSFVTEGNTRVCDVVLADDGNYSIEFAGGSIPSKSVEYLSTLQVVFKNKDKYRMLISTSYEKSFEDITLNLCTNLPTNNVYYNELSNSFVKNVSEDFFKIFILGSNILVVVASMVVYCILLAFTMRRSDLVILKHKEILMINIFAVILLVACLGGTYLTIEV